MNLNKRKILSPNSSYERQEELQRLFINTPTFTENECDVLDSCKTEVPEQIGIIGCLLKEDNSLNNARLLIASLNRYNDELVDKANQLLNRSEEEIETLVKQLAEKFIINTDELTMYEDKVYSILFGMLDSIKQHS